MKAITKHLMPRVWWFLTWFGQWFKHAEGIKGFATQVMNWLMQTTMGLAKQLKNENKKLYEALKNKQAQLARRLLCALVDADEWNEIKAIVKKQGFWITLGIIAETALNYFGVSAVIKPNGWGWMALNAILALVLTGLGIYIFKHWFAILLNKPLYKQVITKRRNWGDWALLTVLCVVYEGAIYYLCKIRGIALEGATTNDYVNNFVTLAGMMLPVIAGYLAYNRSLYTAPYYNTVQVEKLEKEIARIETRIATNNQRMEDHFKCELQKNWALLQEFKVYKENYNLKKGIERETLNGHFSETHESFTREAVQRYKNELLHQEQVQPTYIITEEQKNGHAKKLAPAINL